MSSFGFGPSKKGRIADSSMMTQNVRIVAQGKADATYADNQKKNPFRLSTAILNGYQYGGETIADRNNGTLSPPATAPAPVPTLQPFVNLFSPFTIGTWTLNGSAENIEPPALPGVPYPAIQLAYDVSGPGNNRRSSAFNSNAIINVAYPFSITGTFQTICSAQSSPPTDGFVLVLSTNKNFLGQSGGNLGIVNGETPINALGISINFGDTTGTAQITTNASSDPYTSSKLGLGSIWSDVASNASTTVRVRVAYNSSLKLMTWSVSGSAYSFDSTQTNIDLQTLLGSSNAYLGVTAGSGSRYQPVYLTGSTYQTYG